MLRGCQLVLTSSWHGPRSSEATARTCRLYAHPGHVPCTTYQTSVRCPDIRDLSVEHREHVTETWTHIAQILMNRPQGEKASVEVSVQGASAATLGMECGRWRRSWPGVVFCCCASWPVDLRCLRCFSSFSFRESDVSC